MERLEDALPHAGLSPAVEAAGHRPPRTVSLGQIAPGSSGALYPQDAVYDPAMISVGATSFGLAGRQVWFQTFPLLIGLDLLVPC